MPIYLDFDGIPGDATHAQHVGWMDIESMSIGVSRYMENNKPGSGANREGSQPMVRNMHLTKTSDSSSTALFMEACGGSSGKTATVHLVTTGNPGETYIEYVMENALVARYDVSTGGDRPVEQIELNFTKITKKYIPHDAANQAQSPLVASYDLTTAKTA